MRRFHLAGLAALFALAFAGGAQAQALAKASLRDQTVAPVAVDDYRIGPQDTLQINVFQLSDLNQTVQVDSSGRILLPLLGQIAASGKTAAELSDDIAQRLAVSYVNNPQVTVTIKDAQGSRITVDGAVNQPGVFSLTGPTTLMEAVALAKGPDPKLANMHKVIVFRMVGQQRTTLSYDLAAVQSGRVADPPIYGKDVVVVDTSQGRSALRDLATIAPIVSMMIWAW
jgi:polysaccharide export outer membrane protein